MFHSLPFSSAVVVFMQSDECPAAMLPCRPSSVNVRRMQLDICSIRAVWFVPASDWSCFSEFYELQDESVESWWELGAAGMPLHCVHPATGALLDVFARVNI